MSIENIFVERANFEEILLAFNTYILYVYLYFCSNYFCCYKEVTNYNNSFRNIYYGRILPVAKYI